jgi:hypothetical protein
MSVKVTIGRRQDQREIAAPSCNRLVLTFPRRSGKKYRPRMISEAVGLDKLRESDKTDGLDLPRASIYQASRTLWSKPRGS